VVHNYLKCTSEVRKKANGGQGKVGYEEGCKRNKGALEIGEGRVHSRKDREKLRGKSGKKSLGGFSDDDPHEKKN